MKRKGHCAAALKRLRGSNEADASIWGIDFNFIVHVLCVAAGRVVCLSFESTIGMTQKMAKAVSNQLF